MSFRLFIYYSAAWGGAAALFGWLLGRFIAGDVGLTNTALQAMALGLFVACGLGLLDSLAGSSQRDRAALGVRLFIALMIGAVGGLLGGYIGQGLYQATGSKIEPLLIFGWMLTGVLIGAAPSAFDYLGAVVRKQESQGPKRKFRNGLIGGGIGGLVGGILYLLLRRSWGSVFGDADAEELWSPSAAGFVALGIAIGLAVSLVQVLLRDAWLKVESGFRPGRQLLLTRPETTIGRAESCDVGLFGDAAVEKLHAKIIRQGDNWTLLDNGTPGGTFLNGQRIMGPMPLKQGDRIQVGGSVLSFAVKTKEPAPAVPAPAAIPISS